VIRRWLVVSLLLLVALHCSGSPEPTPVVEGEVDEVEGVEGAEETVPTEDDRADVDDTSVDPLRRANIELYFPSALQTGLVGEYHEIFNTATPTDRVKQIVADLIGGPNSRNALRSLPSGTRLRQAFVLKNGTAYLDFTPELSESLGGGSQRELLAVYSIVDSVALNVREVRRVGILINGQPVDSLNGHLDLRRPLPPDNQWILGSGGVKN